MLHVVLLRRDGRDRGGGGGRLGAAAPPADPPAAASEAARGADGRQEAAVLHASRGVVGLQRK